MIDGVEFSEAGDEPTRFEVELLVACVGDGHWEMVAQRLVRDLGPELAARALVAVLDELGSEKVHTPHRHRFFSGLWAEGRRDWIIDRVVIDNWTVDEIARVLKVSRGRVSQIVGTAGRTKLNTAP
ncbi:MAG: sigma factor-like helix-turn-helix DNA-binding protein [Lysobacter sp.]